MGNMERGIAEREGSREVPQEPTSLEGIRGALMITSSTMEIDGLIEKAMGLILRERREGQEGQGEKGGIDSEDVISRALCKNEVVRLAAKIRQKLTGDSRDHVEAIIEEIGRKVLRA